MRKWMITLAGFTTLMLVSPAFASSASGKPFDIYVMQNGYVLFQINVVRTSLPACGAGHPTRWAFNANSIAGQAKLSLLLTAYSTGKSMEVLGTGNCDQWPDTESVDYFHTLDG